MRTITCAGFVSSATASKIGLQRKEDDYGESGYGRLEPYIQFPPQAQTYGLAHARKYVFYSISSSKELIERCQKLLGDLSICMANRKKKFVTSPVELVVRYVEEHYAESITLNMMAEIVYLSPSYLSSLFKSKQGQSFIDFLTEKRIEKAKTMLRYSDEKIQVISDSTGFTNIRHFNRVFKTLTNRTPTEYREGKNIGVN
ncbi:AraC family transcriptional regulator [Paenibacillus alginolyticus]|uniref:helix-turn-helix domain-containing protein n=1 Tax=Paenibacillus alginolyticus TaxID=59839 RepID=UPI001377821F|nr:AraC family transcriptional regulator [Paenibacillus alginolyticus]MCY9669063.1 AraC family transcriptional regulator [Paenibacillus alginolyticus]